MRIETNTAHTGTRSTVYAYPGELIVDLFAGGGGASEGIETALGVAVDIAINHDPEAIAMHQANHPRTTHYVSDVFEVDPIIATGGRPVGILWASPDCKHFSKAKGGKPVSKKIRSLAWVVVKWARAVRPRIIHLENVEEFQTWGPVLDSGKPCPDRKGETFQQWVEALRKEGYAVEWREMRACDYGAPTIRKRLFVIARRDGNPIIWAKPTHAKHASAGRDEWRTAAECIDWAIPSRSIFERDRPLVAKTCKRLARGVWRHTLNSAKPFIVPITRTSDTLAGASVDEPMRTITTSKGGEFALATLFIAPLRGTSPAHTSTHPVDAPLSTVSGGGTHHALVAAHIVKFRGDSLGHPASDPLPTVTAGGDMARPAGAAHALGLLTAHLEQANGGFYAGEGRDLREPVSTVLQSGSHQQLVTACLIKYYGTEREGVSLREPMHTIPTKDRMGLVEVVKVPATILSPEMLRKAKRVAEFMRTHLPEHFPDPVDVILLGDYALVDLQLRMLVPRELARAQGFHDSYIIDHGADGRRLPKSSQVRMIGNSVCPPMARALVAANATRSIDPANDNDIELARQAS